ncbi:ABC-type nitrate/sulfonate/bicarbonate transport systems, periplasmic components [Cronobacter sakazakii 701]|nr:ABC-type nitrate/sulfonate/bicarbonate transport systems, periplasmic components [Cronobacter sakazakii 701]
MKKFTGRAWLGLALMSAAGLAQIKVISASRNSSASVIYCWM